MSYKIGAVSSARIDDDAIVSSKIADDAIVAAALATDSVTADAVIADGIGASEISANAVGASELADNAVDTAAVADGAITSAKLEDNVSVAGNLVVAGNLSVTGNASEIHLEELKIDEATMTLNREDSTTYSALVSAGDIGLIVKGGTDEDVKMVFDKNGSNPRVNFKDESGDFIEVKGGAGTFTGDISAVGLNASGSVALGSGPNTLQFNANNGAVSASGAITATGGFVGDVTGDISGSSGSCTGLAASATVLATARDIGGVSFNGSASITLPGVNSSGNQDTSGNAATATALATSRTFALTGDITGSAAFDGTGNCSISTTIGANSLVLGTATTGNYVATVAAASGVNGVSVSGSGSETAAVELSLHGSLESAVDAFAAADFSSGQKYLGMWTGSTAGEALSIGGTGISAIAANTDSALRSAAGLGDGYTVTHGDLKSANGRLIESLQLLRPGHASYSSSASSNNSYNATVILEADNATSAVNYHLPLIDNSDASGQKMKYGQKMQLKLSKIGAGGSVVLALPSGQASFDSDTKIDGAASFTLTEANQAITIVAAQDNDGNPQYFIV